MACYPMVHNYGKGQSLLPSGRAAAMRTTTPASFHTAWKVDVQPSGPRGATATFRHTA